MEEHNPPSEVRSGYQKFDPILVPYLRATSESESERSAEQLILVHARPVVQDIIQYKLSGSLDRSNSNNDYQDAEDVCSEVSLELLAWLRRVKADPENNATRNFRGFVAVVAYRACAAYLRKKHPHRLSLKNRIWYTATHHSDFALWKDSEGEWLCGFSAWENKETLSVPARLLTLRNNPSEFKETALAGDLWRMSTSDMMAAIFAWVETPVKLNDLIYVIADLWGIRDQPASNQSREEGRDSQHDRFAATQISFATEIEQRVFLQRVWAEVAQLPRPQRCALLLNLTESPGHGVIALLPILGIASVREIAETLGFTQEQLAEIWNSLPLNDEAIASHLGVTRQQVINLRKSARERLVRRLKTVEGSPTLISSAMRS